MPIGRPAPTLVPAGLRPAASLPAKAWAIRPTVSRSTASATTAQRSRVPFSPACSSSERSTRAAQDRTFGAIFDREPTTRQLRAQGVGFGKVALGARAFARRQQL